MDGFEVSSSFMPAHSGGVEVTLNSNVGLYVCVHEGEGIPTPRYVNLGGMKIKVKLADMQCKSVLTSLQAPNVYFTKSVTAKHNPDWLGEEIFLKVPYILSCFYLSIIIVDVFSCMQTCNL